jgi:hypothetical protein
MNDSLNAHNHTPLQWHVRALVHKSAHNPTVPLKLDPACAFFVIALCVVAFYCSVGRIDTS